MDIPAVAGGQGRIIAYSQKMDSFLRQHVVTIVDTRKGVLANLLAGPIIHLNSKEERAGARESVISRLKGQLGDFFQESDEPAEIINSVINDVAIKILSDYSKQT